MSGTSDHRLLAFRADPDNPTYSTIAWQLVGLAVGGVVVALAMMPLLPDLALRPGWLWSGLAMLAVFLVLLGHEAVHLFHSGGRRVTSPRMAMALVLLCIAMIGCLAVGLGDPATYRLALLIPVLVTAVIGNRAMLATAFALAVLVASATATIDGTSGRALVALAATTIALWGGTTLMVYALARAAIDGIGNSLRLASIAAIASQVDDDEEGLRLVLPELLAVVGADQLWLLRVPHDGEPAVAAATPDPGATGWADAFDLEQVIADRLTVTHRSGGAAFVAEQLDGDLVLVVSRRWNPFGERLVARAILDRAVTSLRLLIDRGEILSRLRELSTLDELTGLPNRRGLTARLELERAAAARTGRPLCIAMVDLDRFKAYNDDFGHLAGDDVLRRVATLLRERLRATDLGARYGGEELCLVLPDTDLAGGAALVEDLLARVRRLPAERPVTFSAGLAQWDGLESIDELLSRADRALYRAKRDGRDRVEVTAGATP
jgi:diguanylate cyclase (GGDEF)-like protein